MTESMNLPAVIALWFVLIFGFVFAWWRMRHGARAEIEGALEQGRAASAVDVATLSERVRAADVERVQFVREREQFLGLLDEARKDGVRFAEVAARVPNLEDQIARSSEQSSAQEKKVLQLSSDLAEKTQALTDSSWRLQQLEHQLATAQSELNEARRSGVQSGEDVARLLAELAGTRDATGLQSDALASERQGRLAAENALAGLTGQLADVTTKCAVFEAKASLIVPLEQQRIELDGAVAALNLKASELGVALAEGQAHLRAERDTVVTLRDGLAKAQSLYTTNAESLRHSALELAAANQCSAVFESQAKRIPALEAKSAELEALYAGTQEQLSNLREASGQLQAELRAERDSLTALKLDWQTERCSREAAEVKGHRLEAELADVTGRLNAECKQTGEKLQLLQQAKEALSDQFKTLATEILDEKTKKFTEQNQTNIAQLLDPLRTKIHEFQGKVEEVYVQEGKDRSALGEQVRQLMELNQVLSQDAKNLTTALKGSSKTQGNWGELILERVLEACGLRRGVEYDVQESHTREDGSRAQPDVVIHLPDDRHLIIDAKVSLLAYESWVSSDDEPQRLAGAKRHLDSMRSHMKGLSDKNYHALYGLKSLDFVLMFVPIEPAFMLAVTHDQQMCMDAYNRNVLLVSPSTLLFVLRTVAHLWRQEAQSRNAQDIARRGGELYDRLVGFVTDLEKVGDRLRQTQESYDDARAKLYKNKGNVVRQAEMLKKLGATSSKLFPPAVLTMAADELEVSDELTVVPLGMETVREAK